MKVFREFQGIRSVPSRILSQSSRRYFIAAYVKGLAHEKRIEARQAHGIAAYRPSGFTPKYRGKVLVGDVGMVAEAIMRKTCKELDIKISDMSVSSDHIHLFIQYLPKYSVSFIAKRLKSRTSRILRQEFPELKKWCKKKSLGTKLLSWKCWTWVGSC